MTIYYSIVSTISNFGGHIKITSVRNQRNNAMYVLSIGMDTRRPFLIKSAFLRVKAERERPREAGGLQRVNVKALCKNKVYVQRGAERKADCREIT